MLTEQERIPFNMVVMHKSGPWAGGRGGNCLKRQRMKAPFGGAEK